MDHRVEPGLYALGEPTATSPVLVTANYKLSFDALRSVLDGHSLWILVLDTRGINVWCAAGEGTFGTAEVVERIAAARLAEIVSHRRIILPQLAAPGVAAHEVEERTGFRVVYGPVRAADLPAFLAARRKATSSMRRVRFDLRDRAAVVPVELVGAGWRALPVAAGLFLLGGLGAQGSFWSAAMQHGLPAALAVLAGVLAGTIITPLALPWLPGRAFAIKGIGPSLLGACALVLAFGTPGAGWGGRLEVVGWLLATLAVGTFLAMNFTGSSTYTSLSGVRREIRLGVPLQLAAAVGAVGAWVASRLLA